VEPSRAQDRPGLAEVAHNLTRTVAERGGTSPLLKHVGGLRDDRENLAVAPRHTRVRHGAVRLVWEASPGVPRYLVRVLGPLGPTAAAEVGGRELVLEADTVEPGAGYVWEIRDAADPSALVALGSGSFGVLDDHAADRLAAQEEEIAALRQVAAGDDSTPDFLAFQACREAELFLEALLRLEGLLATEPEDEALLGERDSLRVLLGLDDARVGMLLRESAGP
jgi:hypothetical protein